MTTVSGLARSCPTAQGRAHRGRSSTTGALRPCLHGARHCDIISAFRGEEGGRSTAEFSRSPQPSSDGGLATPPNTPLSASTGTSATHSSSDSGYVSSSETESSMSADTRLSGSQGTVHPRPTSSDRIAPIKKSSFPVAIVAALVTAPFAQKVAPGTTRPAENAAATSAELHTEAPTVDSTRGDSSGRAFPAAASMEFLHHPSAADEFAASKLPATAPPAVTAAAVEELTSHTNVDMSAHQAPEADSREDLGREHTLDVSATRALPTPLTAAGGDAARAPLTAEFSASEHPAATPPAVTAAAAAEAALARHTKPPPIQHSSTETAAGSTGAAAGSQSAAVQSSSSSPTPRPSVLQEFASSSAPATLPPAVPAAAAAALGSSALTSQPLDSWSSDFSEFDEEDEQLAKQRVMELLVHPEQTEQQLKHQQEESTSQQHITGGVGAFPEYIDAVVAAVRDVSVGTPHSPSSHSTSALAPGSSGSSSSGAESSGAAAIPCPGESSPSASLEADTSAVDKGSKGAATVSAAASGGAGNIEDAVWTAAASTAADAQKAVAAAQDAGLIAAGSGAEVDDGSGWWGWWRGAAGNKQRRGQPHHDDEF